MYWQVLAGPRQPVTRRTSVPGSRAPVRVKYCVPSFYRVKVDADDNIAGFLHDFVSSHGKIFI